MFPLSLSEQAVEQTVARVIASQRYDDEICSQLICDVWYTPIALHWTKYDVKFINIRSNDLQGFYSLSNQGAVSIRKTVLPGMAIPMLKIRRPNGRLIFNMEIAIRR